MNRLQRWYYTAQALGWENLPRRFWQVAKGKLRLNQRVLPGGELTPAQLQTHFAADYSPANVRDYWQQRAARFFFPPHSRAELRAALARIVPAAAWSERVQMPAENLSRGRMPFFNWMTVDVGMPPRFNHDPIHKLDWPTPRHWSRYVQFDPALRDIKCIWEASRFAWAFALARDHVRRPDSGSAELFWRLFDAWDGQNPYGLTPQWACGQESTFRMFAWLFAAIATLDHPAATDARLQRMTERVWYTARHIEGNINFARSQKNNHAISEAVGLWTVGLLFPELARAGHWRRAGKRVLEAELARQIFADGAYVQHSLNYHRVMLDDVLWGMRLGELHGDPVSPAARAAVERAVCWLLEMTEPSSGRTPNYGSNDGALVLPLSPCDYTDYRPIAQAMQVMLRGRRCYEPGPWDETALWMLGPAALSAPCESYERSASVAATAGGYYRLRGPQSWAMVRCCTYRVRPAQADMLHLDLWHGATNVLRDAGSYFYYTDEPWQHHFHSTAAHNTVEIDRSDQMIKGPRFLWLRWTKARLLRCEHSPDGRVALFAGEHYGYHRLPGRVAHRRTVVRLDDSYVVIDDILGGGEHEVALRWRLCDTAWDACERGWATSNLAGGLRIEFSGVAELRTELLRGQESPEPEGWESLYYADRQPVPVVRVRGRAALPLRLATCIAPASGPRLSKQERLTPAEPIVLANLPAALADSLVSLGVPLRVE